MRTLRAMLGVWTASAATQCALFLYAAGHGRNLKLLACGLFLGMSFFSQHAQSIGIEEIKADMRSNEAALLNTTARAAWAKSGYIGMGNAPRGDATPYWWQPANPEFKSAIPWKAITPWFVIYPGSHHAARNVRVKVFGIKVFIQRKSTQKWVKVDTGDGKPTWASSYRLNLGVKTSKAEPRVEPDGQLSYRLTPDFNPIHGSMPKYDLTRNGIDPLDINAVFVTAKTQLILDDPAGIDDRASAQILFSVGADYYPTVTTKIADFAPMSYVPAVGGSRYGVVGTIPRIHFMSTIDIDGAELRKRHSEYTKRGGAVVIPAHQLGANMPPVHCIAAEAC